MKFFSFFVSFTKKSWVFGQETTAFHANFIIHTSIYCCLKDGTDEEGYVLVSLNIYIYIYRFGICLGMRAENFASSFFLSPSLRAWCSTFGTCSRKLRALRNRFRLGKTSRDRTMRPTTDGYPLPLIHSTDEKVSKAAKAAKYVKKGAKGKLLKKRFSPTFHRPRTLKNARAPKYPRVSVPPPQKLDQFQVRNSCFTRW
jgi:hypothetical protein